MKNRFINSYVNFFTHKYVKFTKGSQNVIMSRYQGKIYWVKSPKPFLKGTDGFFVEVSRRFLRKSNLSLNLEFNLRHCL